MSNVVDNSADGLVTATAVGFSFRGVAALDGVSQTFGTGTTAVVGRNGAGKSTLVRVLASALRPDSGEVTRSGVSIHSTASALVRHRRDVGWLPQEPSFSVRMTVDRLLQYGSWLKSIDRFEADEAVEQALSYANMTALRDRRLGELSGGQRRRAALAVALVGSPSLVLLDEPTNGLDPIERERFLGHVREYSRGRTVVLATHLLEDVELACDRWVALHQGSIAGRGTISSTSRDATAKSLENLRAALVGNTSGLDDAT